MEQHQGITQAPVRIVLDTSVLLKWVFTEEEDSDKAIVLKDRHLGGEVLIIIPELAVYEFANVIQHPRRGLSLQQVQDFVDLLYETELMVIPSHRRIQKMATAMASFIGTSVYDCVFAVIGALLDCLLITADERAHQKMAQLPNVRLLRNT